MSAMHGSLRRISSYALSLLTLAVLAGCARSTPDPLVRAEAALEQQQYREAIIELRNAGVAN
ncbi:MAG: hypothetical protein AAFX85_08000, partial [Pseudomonadota bacterium]